MASYGQVAAGVRKHKETCPEKYCANARCLWRTDKQYCPRHQPMMSVRESVLAQNERERYEKGAP